MAALQGNEVVLVTGVTHTGVPSGSQFQATTQQIANLAGGGGAPGGTNGQIQFNNSGAFGGITVTADLYRIISSISTNTNAGAAANTEYIYLVSGTTTLTLPTAVGNTNKYTIKRVGTGVVTIATTSAQTIDGSSSASLNVQYVSLSLVSDNANWNII